MSKQPVQASPTFEDLCLELRQRVEQGVLTEQQSAIHTAGELKDFLGVRLELHNYRFARTRYRDLLWIVRNGVPADFRFKGSTIVDIGCGSWNPWGMSFLYLMLGAAKAYAIDLDPVIDPSRAARGLAELASIMLTNPKRVAPGHPIDPHEVLDNVRSFDLGKLEEGDATGIDTKRLIHRLAGAQKLPLADGEADLLVSQACFEHVADMDEVMAELARATRRGGIGIHGVDSTDHRRYENPRYDALDYLCLQPASEHFFLGLDDRPEVGHYMNRLRPSQYPAIFARHGFEVIKFNTWLRCDIDERRRAMFVEPFRSMSLADLSTVSGEFVLRRI
jgi:SAM-dependent methyltransferase